MPKQPASKLRLTGPAQRDIVAIIRWSIEHFGRAAAVRYEALILQAIRDIAADPNRLGSKERPELMIDGARTYHMSLSRKNVDGVQVKEPRHFILYRSRPDGIIEVGRILHELTDLQRHLPDDYQIG
ncbi:MAG: type II toxin-antitoxin system RelE/ParE family toxin [Terriglobus sp.]